MFVHYLNNLKKLLKFICNDLRKDFVENYIWTATQAGVLYEDRYLLGTSIARPCITRDWIRVAQRENAMYIAHGATGKGNDQIRFELAANALDAKIKIISPWRIPAFYERFRGRVDLFAYAEKNNIPLPITPKSPWSMDANLMHISYESGVLDDPSSAAPSDIYIMTKGPSDWPDTEDLLEIHFKTGKLN